MKPTLTALLTILMLPLTAAASVAMVALLLAMLALFSPIIVFWGALLGAGKLSEKLTQRMFPHANNSLDPEDEPLYTPIALTLILTPLLIAPVAVGSAVIAAVVSILLVPIMTIGGAYRIAENAINRLSGAIGLNTEEPAIAHSYNKIPQDSEEQEVPTDAPCFGPLFKKLKQHGYSLVKNNASVEDNDEMISLSDSTSSYTKD